MKETSLIMQFDHKYGILLFLIPLSLFLLAGCAQTGAGRLNPSSGSLPGSEAGPPVPTLDSQKVVQGQELYVQHCAACHGLNGEGQPDWKTPNEDGSFKPPPHDAAGHTWHHDDDLLIKIVTQGSSFPQSQMPTFGDKLSDEEVQAILEYIKSWWGPEERAFQWQVTWQTQQQK